MHSTFGNCAKTLEIALIEGQILGKRFVQDVCICSVFMAPRSSSSGMYFLILCASWVITDVNGLCPLSKVR